MEHEGRNGKCGLVLWVEGRNGRKGRVERNKRHAMGRSTLGGREQGVEGSKGEEVLVVTCAPSINTKAVSW